MKSFSLIATFVVLVAVPARAPAHEGHEHKAMGIVKVIDASHIELETTDEKKVSIELTKQTKFLKGKSVVAMSDLKVGDRAVVVYTEAKEKKTARRVLLGAAAEEKAAPKHH